MCAVAAVPMLALLAAACSNPIADAEKRYEIVKNSGRASEICTQGKALTAAYLQAKDADGYRRRDVETDIECQSATFDERNGIYRMPDGSKQKVVAEDMLGNAM